MTVAGERARVFLQAGQDRRLAQGHPWAYSNEIRMDAESKALPPGALATLHRVDGKPLGVGTFTPHALIAFRLFDRDHHASIDVPWFRRRLEAALARRQCFFDEPYYRLVHAEADGLPGLIVDRYADVVVVQLNTAGMDALRDEVLAAIDALLEPVAIVLRNDARARALEGLALVDEVVKGSIPDAVPVQEGGLRFFADVLAGQKTGWFFDQRENRAVIAPLAKHATLLDVYCHSGGFAVAAAAAGAITVLGIDSSESALALAGRAAEANDVAARCTFQRGDAFAELARLAGEGRRFGVVVADPPAFVKARKDLGSGRRGYRKLSRLAAALVEPGGFLFVASCSHPIEAGMLLTEVVHGVAALGRGGRIVRQAGAGPDHPVHLHLPETAYLKTLLLQLD